jgi:hypothetical protein
VSQSLNLPRLRDDQQAIYALSSIVSANQDTTVVESEIFLGDLQGHLRSPMLNLHQTIKKSQFGASQAALAAITLYGLGNQALDSGHKAVACAIYRKAAQAISGVSMGAMGAPDFASALDQSRAAAC